MPLAHVQPGTDRGYSRRRAGKGFAYRDPDGRPVRDRAAIARFRALAIPPAWTEVWICADPDGHVQAVGRDARHRLQYRYHPAWRAARDRDKYGKLIDFCRGLPALRRRVARDLASDDCARETVAAAVVALLERGYLRVGNDEYTRENGSYGATTLEGRHVRLHGDALEIHFRGKSGIDLHVEIEDGALAEVLRRVRRLPGTRLFQYEQRGRVFGITSVDVNRYLRAVLGPAFSAKDFRTWAATIHCALRLAAQPHPETPTAAKRAITAAIKEVAERLGHTATVCRASYIHPRVLTAFTDGSLAPHFPDPARKLRAFEHGVGRASAEKGLIALLSSREHREQRLAA